MATFTKVFLSGSNQGLPISLSTTTSSVHTTTTTNTTIDEVWLWGINYHPTSASISVTVTMGPINGTFTTASVIPLYANGGLTNLLPGLPLATSGSTQMRIGASAVSASCINVIGYVNRIT